MDWLWYLLLLLTMAFGLFLNILGLPGLWLNVAAVAAYAWITGFDGYVGWASLGTLIGLAVVAEIIEFVAGGAGAKSAGGTRRAMLGGIIGAMIGGVFLSLLPIPIVSTIVGACLGAFLGASAVELAIYRNPARAMRVGTGAAKGRFWGIVYKSAVGCLMFVLAAAAAFPVARATPAKALPTTTQPTTQ
jgi:uncharacterized protein YqgC (DUF456 family)